jgi:hypothetical protein
LKGEERKERSEVKKSIVRCIETVTGDKRRKSVRHREDDGNPKGLPIGREAGAAQSSQTRPEMRVVMRSRWYTHRLKKKNGSVVDAAEEERPRRDRVN